MPEKFEIYAKNLVEITVALAFKKKIASFEQIYNAVLNSRVKYDRCPFCGGPHNPDEKLLVEELKNARSLLEVISRFVSDLNRENMIIQGELKESNDLV